MKTVAGEGKKKTRNFGASTLRGPTFSKFGPPPFGAPLLGVQKFNFQIGRSRISRNRIGRSRKKKSWPKLKLSEVDRAPPDHPKFCRGFTRQLENLKRAQLKDPALEKHHQNSARRHPERKTERKWERRKKKFAKFWPPTLPGFTLRGHTLRGPNRWDPPLGGFFCVLFASLLFCFLFRKDGQQKSWSTIFFFWPKSVWRKSDWPKLVKWRWPKSVWPKSVSAFQTPPSSPWPVLFRRFGLFRTISKVKTYF